MLFLVLTCMSGSPSHADDFVDRVSLTSYRQTPPVTGRDSCMYTRLHSITLVVELLYNNQQHIQSTVAAALPQWCRWVWLRYCSFRATWGGRPGWIFPPDRGRRANRHSHGYVYGQQTEVREIEIERYDEIVACELIGFDINFPRWIRRSKRRPWRRTCRCRGMRRTSAARWLSRRRSKGIGHLLPASH